MIKKSSLSKAFKLILISNGQRLVFINLLLSLLILTLDIVVLQRVPIFIKGLEVKENNEIIIFLILVLISGLARISIIKISTLVDSKIAKKIYETVLNSIWKKSTSELEALGTSKMINIINNDLSKIMCDCLIPISRLMMNLSIIGGIVIYMTIIFKAGIVLPVVVTGIIYFLIVKFIRKRLSKISLRSFSIRDNLASSASLFINNRRLLIANKEIAKVFSYIKSEGTYEKYLQGEITFLTQLPKIGIESIGIIIIVVIAISINDSVGTLTSLGILIYAFQRLLPSIQYCFVAYANLRQFKPSINRLLYFINKKQTDEKLILAKIFERVMPIKENQIFQSSKNQIGYIKYKIKNYSKKINLFDGDIIKLSGQSGSGKSTLIDLIVGTNYPYKVKGSPLIVKGDLNIFYCTQSIFSSDQNVIDYLLGNYCQDSTPEKNQADIELVLSSLEKAQFAEFGKTLNESLYSRITEGGKSMSGGQMQRLLIAKVILAAKKNDNLYKICILDETLSGIDNTRKNQIIKTLRSIFNVLIIASHDTSIEEYYNRKIELG